MELQLYTEAFFDAAHFIEGYEGKCAHLHGHTWKVCLWVRGDESRLDGRGILWDFSNAKRIAQAYDHRNLNEVMHANPTAERLALEAYRAAKEGNPELQFKVRVYENVVSRESYCETGDFR
jgi:6-pyruvoyltetrahydropterin/6-carboxytetrahydropterin synthase